MKFVTIDITKEDIKEGQRIVSHSNTGTNRAMQCPVARAAHRAGFPRAVIFGYRWLPEGEGNLNAEEFPLTQKQRITLIWLTAQSTTKRQNSPNRSGCV